MMDKLGRGSRHFVFALLALALGACTLIEEEDTGVRQDFSLGEALNTTPAGWWWYYGQSPAQVSELVNNTGGRIVSLQVESSSPLIFTVALVHNSGTHAKTWWWYHGQTGSQLSTLVSNLNARIVNLHPYVVNGTTYFAAVLLSNTGADAAGWWWYYGVTPAQISTALTNNNARLVDLNRYTVNGSTYYAAVMIQNSGTWGRAWWYYYGVSGNTVASLLGQNNAMLTNIEHAAGDGSTFDVVMEQPPSSPHWWWY